MMRQRRTLILACCAIAAAVLAIAAAGGIRSWTRHPLESGVLRGANVLLVTIDTLRADRVGSYGSQSGLTPTLDRLSREGVRFERVYAAAPLTLPSHTSIMTGLYPTGHGVRDNGSFRFDGSRATLASVLKANGYRTAAFVGAFVLDARFGLNYGFDHYDDRYGDRPLGAELSLSERPADRVIAPALEWIGKTSTPWFVWIHLYDPHEPYNPPEPYRSRFSGDSYGGEIAFADAQLGTFLDTLQARGLLDRTLIAAASDHGEALGDHQERTHGLFAYDATLRVPLILWSKDALAPAIVKHSARLADVMPTIVDLTGIAAPSGLDGRTLRPLINDEERSGRDAYFEALNATLTRNWAPLTGIVADGFKLIDLPVPELYDLQRDPGERENLYARSPEIARRLESRLDAVTRAARPAAPARMDTETEQRLRSLGYVVTAAQKPARAFTARDDPKNLIDVNNALDHAVDLLQRGRVDESAAVLRQVIDQRPDLTIAYDRLALVLRQSGRAHDAVAVLETAVRKGLADRPLLASLGEALREAEEPAKSAATLEAALRMDPSDVGVSEKLALTYIALGRGTDAERLFKQILSSDPTSARTLNNLGSLRLAEGRYPEAIEVLAQAVSLDPELATAHNGLGVAYAKTGRVDRAIAEWETAVRLNPAAYDVLFNLGMILLKTNRAADGREYLRRFADSAPPARYGSDIAEVRRILENGR